MNVRIYEYKLEVIEFLLFAGGECFEVECLEDGPVRNYAMFITDYRNAMISCIYYGVCHTLPIT